MSGKVERITIIFPADFKEINSEGRIVYADESISWSSDKRGDQKWQSCEFLTKSTTATMIKRIENAIRHLNSFCAEELKEQGEPF
ncbi:hypothetical protein AGMMS50239_03120 [Bacteroidia bacterium]|nr:hypothetical protein AGMMS50239_03120 [Bacteroidia bacterium]